MKSSGPGIFSFVKVFNKEFACLNRYGITYFLSILAWVNLWRFTVFYLILQIILIRYQIAMPLFCHWVLFLYFLPFLFGHLHEFIILSFLPSNNFWFYWFSQFHFPLCLIPYLWIFCNFFPPICLKFGLLPFLLFRQTFKSLIFKFFFYDISINLFIFLYIF